jgi:hypothetical protein
MRAPRFLRRAGVGGGLAGLAAPLILAAVPAGAATSSATALYNQSIKVADTANVHYVSKATQDNVALEVIGDTGVSEGSEVLAVESSSAVEDIEVVLKGATGYVRGNATALQELVGLSAAISKAHANQWLSFPSTKSAESNLVSGLRNSDLSVELSMTGPFTLGGTKKISGIETRAIDGFSGTSTSTRTPIILYVETGKTPRPVEEVTNPNGTGTAIKGSVTFSKWGESIHPKEPSKSVSLPKLLKAKAKAKATTTTTTKPKT